MKTAISLFSGAGGDSLGLEQAGYRVVAFSECDKDAIATHLAQFPNSTLLQHEKNTNIQQLPDSVFTPYQGTVDLIFAGFPCQGFSHAGKKKSDDPRNELVHEFVRATRLIQPEWIIGENVKGLLSRIGYDPVTQTQQPVIKLITSLFNDIGYQLAWHVLDASQYGVPQSRKRLIIIGHRGPLYIQWKQPPIVPPYSIRFILEDTLYNSIPTTIPSNEDKDRFWIPSVSQEVTGTPHPNLIRLLNGVRGLTPTERLKYPDSKTITEPEPLLSYGRRASGYHGEIVDPDTPSKTIICTYQSCPRLFVGMIHGNQRWLRTLTLTELAQIQGFPKEYPFKGHDKSIIKQIGNAVPPPLIKHVVLSLDTILLTEEEVEQRLVIEDDDEDDE